MTRPALMAALLSVATLGCASAQPPRPAPDAVRIGNMLVISPAAAERRIALQGKVNIFAEQLKAKPAFGGLRVFETPTSYRVLVKFKGRKPSPTELTSDPELQAVLEVGEASRSEAELTALRDRIMAVAIARKIDTMMFVDGITGKVEVHVRDVEAFRAALAESGIGEDDVRLKKTEDFPRPR